jgi:hypothetical protein
MFYEPADAKRQPAYLTYTLVLTAVVYRAEAKVAGRGRFVSEHWSVSSGIHNIFVTTQARLGADVANSSGGSSS